MGDKVAAKAAAARLGIPVVPGSPRARCANSTRREAAAAAIGYPVLIKAAAGGGGRGMRVARDRAELSRMLPLAQPRRAAFFGRARSISNATSTGRGISRSRCSATARAASFISASATARCSARTRRCSRRRPRPRSTPTSATELGALAVAALREARLPKRRHARIPVPGRRILLHRDEHAAPGRASDLRDGERHRHRARADAHRRRRAARLPPSRDSAVRPRDRVPDQRRASRELPAVARADRRLSRPGGLGVRVDSALYQGYDVPPHYDSLVAKLIVHGTDRNECLMRLRRALEEYRHRRHRHHHPAAPAPGRRARFHQRRLRHPLARAALSGGRNEPSRAVSPDPRHSAARLCRRDFPDGGIGRGSRAVLGRSASAAACCRSTASTCRAGCAALCGRAGSRSAATRISRGSSRGCAEATEERPKTWINERDRPALCRAVHRQGYAHSVEVLARRRDWWAGFTAWRWAARFSARACSAA